MGSGRAPPTVGPGRSDEESCRQGSSEFAPHRGMWPPRSALPCPGESRWGGVSGGGGTHLPSAIALFILGVGEGTSGGAKSSGGGTILEKAEQVLVQKLQPERGAERGEGALPVPVPSLIGGMSSPRAGVSIQARLPLPPCPPACLLPPSSLLPAARTGPGPELRRIPRRQSRRRRRGARSLAAADPGSERAGRGAWRGDECFMGSCGLT